MYLYICKEGITIGIVQLFKTQIGPVWRPTKTESSHKSIPTRLISEVKRKKAQKIFYFSVLLPFFWSLSQTENIWLSFLKRLEEEKKELRVPLRCCYFPSCWRWCWRMATLSVRWTKKVLTLGHIFRLPSPILFNHLYQTALVVHVWLVDWCK